MRSYLTKQKHSHRSRLTRSVSLLLAAALFCTVLPVSASAAVFSDVPDGMWYSKAVNEMANRGIVSGTGNGRFSPNGLLTRAEFATMLSKCALSGGELKEYVYATPFSDVPQSHWASRFINWASEAGVIAGTGGGKFSPSRNVTRQDIAVMVARYAKAMGLELPQTNGPMLFLDANSIDDYAKASVTACQRAGLISSRGNMLFVPKGTATRAEAALILYNLLNKARASDYRITRKRMYGTSIAAVDFDPSKYTASVAMGNGRARGGESVRSLVSRTGAKICVNAAFFDMDSYEALGTIIANGRIVTTFDRFAPAKSAIVMDSSGSFSVENFTTRIQANLTTVDGDLRSVPAVMVNRLPGPGDGSRIIFTSDWGDKLNFTAGFAAVVDASGTVTAVYRNQDVAVPKSGEGYVFALRAPRNDRFEAGFIVGASLDIAVEYEGSGTQDIQVSLGTGPKIVENGRPYGNSSTYSAEGYGLVPSGGGVRRVCIGVRYDGRLVILTAETSLAALSNIMVAMGCQSAVNLDGGGSANLYVNGMWLYGPQSRMLNNVLYFK